MLAYINFPSWISPRVFSFLPEGSFLDIIRWYGLSYIFAIVLAYIQSLYIIKHDKITTINKDKLDDFFFWAVVGVILGARIFFCIFYDFGYYAHHIWEILIPIRNGKFAGFQGMSYHGGAIGVTIAALIFTKLKKINFREICDTIFPAIPLGYTLGRLANFMNGELWGRPTTAPWGMIFKNARTPLNYQKTQEVMSKLGWKVVENGTKVVDKMGHTINGVLGHLSQFGYDVTGQANQGANLIPAINLPRHPSQLYEAFFEGIVLYLIMWFIGRRFKPFKGFLASLYLAGYGTFRIVIEFFRQPDIQFANFVNGKFIGTVAGGITMGQILSILMVVSAIFVGIYFYFLSKKDNTELSDKPVINNLTEKNRKKRINKKK